MSASDQRAARKRGKSDDDVLLRIRAKLEGGAVLEFGADDIRKLRDLIFPAGKLEEIVENKVHEVLVTKLAPYIGRG